MKQYGKLLIKIKIMKKLILFVLLFYFVNAKSQPVINNVTINGYSSYPISAPFPTIGKYEKFELDIDVKKLVDNSYYLNPNFTNEIEVWAIFQNTTTGKEVRVGGFFYQGYTKTTPLLSSIPPIYYNPSTEWYVIEQAFYKYCNTHATPYSAIGQHPYEKLNKTGFLPIWKIRFSPTEIGEWTFKIYAKDPISQVDKIQTNFKFNCVNSSNKGFIRIANKRYLKYDNNDKYFPIGTGRQIYQSVCYLNDPAWGLFSPEVYGTVEHETYIEKLFSNKVNFIRIFLLQEGINIFGYDYGMDVCFFKNVSFKDPTNNFGVLQNSFGINLRDAWQLDYIINKCEEKNIKVQLALTNSDEFGYNNLWETSIYNIYGDNVPPRPATPYLRSTFTKLTSGCNTPYDFFSNTEANQFQKLAAKYIIDRYGYSTSILSWELLNEIVNIHIPSNRSGNEMISWVSNMYNYIKTIDPNQHLITCSTGPNLTYDTIDVTVKAKKINAIDNIAKIVDYTDDHHYFWPLINPSNPSNKQVLDGVNLYQVYNKPHFITESGDMDPAITHANDPNGFSFHSLCWSSCFSGSLGQIINHYCDTYVMLDNLDLNYYGTATFMEDVKLDEDNNFSYKTYLIPFGNNGVNNYYMVKNKKEIYGWAQDNNFTVERLNQFYQSSYPPYKNYLKNLTGRPPLSDNLPKLYFSNMLNGQYDVQFYNTITGNAIGSPINVTALSGNLIVNIPPTLLSDPLNKYADIAYKIKKNCHTQECGWNENPLNLKGTPSNSIPKFSISPNSLKFFYSSTVNDITHSNFNKFSWDCIYLNLSLKKVRSGSKIITDNDDRVYYIGVDNILYCVSWNATSGWSEIPISSTIPVYSNGVTIDAFGNIYFTGNLPSLNKFKIYKIPKSGSAFLAPIELTSTYNYVVSSTSDLSFSYLTNEIYFVSSNNTLSSLTYATSNWNFSTIAPSNMVRPSTQIICDKLSNRIFWIANDNKIYNTLKISGIWNTGALSNDVVCLGNNIEYAEGNKIFYVGPSNVLYNVIWTEWGWLNGALNTCRVTNCDYNSSLIYLNDKLYFIGTDLLFHYAFWNSNACPPYRISNTANNDTILKTENLKNSQFNIYPNPASNELNILYSSTNSLEDLDLLIENTLGQVVIKKSIINNSVEVLNTKDLHEGIYFVIILDKTKNNFETKKIIITK